jgi:hypothetical protein
MTRANGELASESREHCYLGYFTDEVQAARAYDVAARTRFGVFANCNFPLQE